MAKKHIFLLHCDSIAAFAVNSFLPRCTQSLTQSSWRKIKSCHKNTKAQKTTKSDLINLV